MKGLIRKDLYMLWKYMKVMLIAVGGFAVLSFAGDSNSFILTIYPGIITGMLPMTLLAYDEMEHFCPWCDSLPVTRKDYVTAKYLVGLLIGGGTFCLMTVAQVLRLILMGGAWGELPLIMSFLAGASVLAPAVMLPFAFRYGTQKGRILYCAVIGGAFAANGILAESGGLAISGGMAVFFVITAAVYLLSWYLSVRFYQKREL